MEYICDLINNGSYSIPRSYGNNSQPKGIVDHFRQVLYCNIGKTGSTSWLKMFKIITAIEKTSRKKWFENHSYPWCPRRLTKKERTR